MFIESLTKKKEHLEGLSGARTEEQCPSKTFRYTIISNGFDRDERRYCGGISAVQYTADRYRRQLQRVLRAGQPKSLTIALSRHRNQ